MRRELNSFSRVQSQISVGWFEAYKTPNPAHRLDTDKKRVEQQQTKFPEPWHSRGFGFASIRERFGFFTPQSVGTGLCW